MLAGLSALLVLVIAVAVWRHSVVDGRVELNGFLFFSAGFFLYWGLPLFFVTFARGAEPDAFGPVVGLLDRIDESALTLYAAASVAYYLAFWGGYALVARKSRPEAIRYPQVSAGRLVGAAAVAFVVAAIMADRVSEHLFRGYHPALFDSYEGGLVADALPRGAFVASVTALFVVCFMLSTYATQRSSRISDFLLEPPMLICGVFEVLVLSMGGRLYFASHALAVLSLLSLRYRLRVRPVALVALGVGVLVLLGAYGLFRMGDKFRWEDAVANVAQEPAFISASLFSFLGTDKLPVFAWPRFFLSDLANLLPSAFFPEKLSWFLRPEDFGYTIYAPFGGMHLFVSLTLNVGWLGAVGVFAGFGAGLAFAWRKASSWAGSAVYCCLCGWAAFTIFRDPLSVSLVKNVLQMSLLLPALLVLIVVRPRSRVGADLKAGADPADRQQGARGRDRAH